jgi:exopolysaccharide biosynthesis operon protein EpsL
MATLVMMASHTESRAEFADGDVVKINLGAGVAYDDNVFRLPSNVTPSPASGSTKRGDTIFTLNAGAAVNKDISRQNFILGANVIQQLYVEHSDFDITLFNFGGTWNWRVGNQWGGEIGYTQNEYSNSFLDVSSFTQNKRTVGIPVASIGYQFHPSWELRAKYRYVDISNSEARFKLSDLEQSEYEGAVRYRTQFGNLVDLYYRYTDGERPNVVTDVLVTDPLLQTPGQFEQNDFGVNVARWELSGRSRFSGFLAYTNRSYDQFANRDFSGPTGNLTFVYLPTGNTSVSLSLYRLIGAYTDVTANYIVTTGVTLAPTWQATSKLAFGMNAFYQDRDYKGTPGIALVAVDQDRRNDDVYNVGVNATYAILRSLKGTLYYTWTKRDSNIEAFNFRDNIVGAGLEWTF